MKTVFRKRNIVLAVILIAAWTIVFGPGHYAVGSIGGFFLWNGEFFINNPGYFEAQSESEGDRFGIHVGDTIESVEAKVVPWYLSCLRWPCLTEPDPEDSWLRYVAEEVFEIAEYRIFVGHSLQFYFACEYLFVETKEGRATHVFYQRGYCFA